MTGESLAHEIETLLGGYGPPPPTLLPWLARWTTPERLPAVARAAAGQADLAPAQRWPAVTDAAAEVLAAQVTKHSWIGPEVVEILPLVAAHLNGSPLTHALRGQPAPDAVGYAELTHPGLHLAPRTLLSGRWRAVLTAAQVRSVPPLANLPMLTRLVASPFFLSSELADWEAAYLLPYLPDDSFPEDAAAGALFGAADYVADDSTAWYTAAICARIAPYLDDDQRGTIGELARAAPPAWRSLLSGCAQRRTPWPSAVDELAAAQPALSQLDEMASEVNPAALAAACALTADRIDGKYNGHGNYLIGSAESSSREQADGPIYRPTDNVTRGAGWLELREPPPPSPPPPVEFSAERGLFEERHRERSEPDRYLVGECPATVAIGQTFGLLVRITTTAVGGAKMNYFPVPDKGRDVRVWVNPCEGVRLRSQQLARLHVPRSRDSERVLFELQADAPGPRQVDVLVFVDGAPVGELKVEFTAEIDARSGSPSRTVTTQIDPEPADGTVALMVHYDPDINRYRFIFSDGNYDDEVRQQLSYEPGPQVERLIAELDEFANGRTSYSRAGAQRALRNRGKALWRELLPETLREQFWERQGRIKRLIIVSKQDTTPWEVMYPRDQGKDSGFLVEQFPVTRWIFGRPPARSLPLGPARFVLPSGSRLQEAEAEIDAVRAILEPNQPPDEVLTAYDELCVLADTGDFGVLHFACHNNFEPGAGSSIKFDDGQFQPDDLEDARADKSLVPSAPIVFINACRSAGAAVRYNQLDGWAQAFFEAGAAVFIGSLWAIETSNAKDFAVELYTGLEAGRPLGEVVTAARQAAASGGGDPTWLAYTVYGDATARKAT